MPTSNSPFRWLQVRRPAAAIEQTLPVFAPAGHANGLSASIARHRTLVMALGAILLIRLLTIGLYPLTDTSEARYGEIARLMVELNDWVTPWFDHGVPFWGKPPLTFWLSAASAEVFGISEFALRLPSFLLALGMLALIGVVTRVQSGERQAWTATLLLSSSALFFVASGAILTDTALAFAVTLAMAAFWQGIAARNTHALTWRYVLFLALGLGLLAKGPVAGVLICGPIGVWAVLSGRLRQTIREIPWLSGSALMLLIAVPWYVLAEQRTPGFLKYFLAGENFMRYVDPQWTGDLYGNIHTSPKGYIWLLWLGASLPWSGALLLIAALNRRRGGAANPAAARVKLSQWHLYLLCFALFPGVLFTFAGSVLATYLLPGMPALAILAAALWANPAPTTISRMLPAAAVALPLLFILALPLLLNFVSADKSQQRLLENLPAQATVIYYPKRPFSGQFYSEGHALEAASIDELQQLLQANRQSYVVTKSNAELPSVIADKLRPLAQEGRRHPRTLWASRNPAPQ